MPIYAFRCVACGHDFDRLQKLSDPDPETCPVCGAGPVQRQLTAPSFRLSGSGWYETDFKKDGKKRNLTEGGEGSAKPKADGGSSDAKSADAKPASSSVPAAKTEAKSDAKSDAKPKPAS